MLYKVKIITTASGKSNQLSDVIFKYSGEELITSEKFRIFKRDS